MDETQIDLRAYLHILARRRLVILFTLVLVLGLTMAYTLTRTPVYSATADVLIPQQQANSALDSQNSQSANAQTLQRTLVDDQQFAQGDAVKAAATSKLGYKTSVSIGASTSADVLTFKGKSTDKAKAAAMADAYASAYISASTANEVGLYSQQVQALEAKIVQLQNDANKVAISDPSQYQAIQASITPLTETVSSLSAAAQIQAQSGATLVKQAQIPSSPTSPKPVKDGLLALFAGLILGLVLALVRERLDDRVNSLEDIQQASHSRPVVGVIPMVDSWKSRGTHLALIEDPFSPVAEAYRTLRTAVQFFGIDEPKSIIGITSAAPGEGKTTVSANLALAFARTGARVIVVSCDLRRPRLHEFFGLSNDVGLTSVLLGHVTLAEALHHPEGEVNLRVLSSGPMPPNPAEILALDRVRELCEVLASRADIVLLDCPPVLPVTDTLLLSRVVDGMLVLGTANTTSKRALKRTYDMLTQVKTPVFGTVVNRVPVGGQRGYSYDYGYGYGYDYQYQPVESKKRGKAGKAAKAAKAAKGREASRLPSEPVRYGIEPETVDYVTSAPPTVVAEPAPVPGRVAVAERPEEVEPVRSELPVEHRPAASDATPDANTTWRTSNWEPEYGSLGSSDYGSYGGGYGGSVPNGGYPASPGGSVPNGGYPASLGDLPGPPPGTVPGLPDRDDGTLPGIDDL